jgi:hypothetical protein
LLTFLEPSRIVSLQSANFMIIYGLPPTLRSWASRVSICPTGSSPATSSPGATVITDAWMGYYRLAGLGYVQQRRSKRADRARGDDPGELRPRCTGLPRWPSGGY